MLKLQGQKQTIEPYILHLFKGGLLFESLLKFVGEKYCLVNPQRKGRKYKTYLKFTIDDFNSNEFFTNNYCNFSLKEQFLKDLILLDSHNQRIAFGITHKLRNATGHNLKQEIMLTANIYNKLFQHEMASLLYIITKEFIISP